MLEGKNFLDYNNLFSLNDYEKNYEIVLKFFSIKCRKYRKFKNPKKSYLFYKISYFNYLRQCGSKCKIIFKE